MDLPKATADMSVAAMGASNNPIGRSIHGALEQGRIPSQTPHQAERRLLGASRREFGMLPTLTGLLKNAATARYRTLSPAPWRHTRCWKTNPAAAVVRGVLRLERDTSVRTCAVGAGGLHLLGQLFVGPCYGEKGGRIGGSRSYVVWAPCRTHQLVRRQIFP